MYHTDEQVNRLDVTGSEKQRNHAENYQRNVYQSGVNSVFQTSSSGICNTVTSGAVQRNSSHSMYAPMLPQQPQQSQSKKMFMTTQRGGYAVPEQNSPAITSCQFSTRRDSSTFNSDIQQQFSQSPTPVVPARAVGTQNNISRETNSGISNMDTFSTHSTQKASRSFTGYPSSACGNSASELHQRQSSQPSIFRSMNMQQNPLLVSQHLSGFSSVSSPNCHSATHISSSQQPVFQQQCQGTIYDQQMQNFRYPSTQRGQQNYDSAQQWQ